MATKSTEISKMSHKYKDITNSHVEICKLVSLCLRGFTAFIIISTSPLLAKEQAPMVAVASNFMGAMEKIADAYESETGVKLQTVYSSTGKLYAQIKQGAPYDLFFAADAERPELLAQEGLCEEPFIYAIGEAVLWTKNKALADAEHWQDVIVRDDINKIAVSTPQTAPYGTAAFEALNRQGILSRIENKLVYGHNVAQPFQFAFHGSVDLGFTALSLALSDKGKQGVFWLIPEADKVVQKGCVVKSTKNKHGVGAFLAFFQLSSTKTILNEFGYK
jgi:molybdate transport system substrate-binding protein